MFKTQDKAEKYYIVLKGKVGVFVNDPYAQHAGIKIPEKK